MADETAKFLTCADAGRIGGAARARKLTPDQRRDIARRAAQARWGKKAGSPETPDPNDPKGPHRDQQGAEAGILLSRHRRKPSVSDSVTSRPGALRAAA